jgi:hypothetical protein
MKLLCLHVSEHRDENIVRPIWNRIFEDGDSLLVILPFYSLISKSIALDDDADPQTNADRIIAKIVPLGQRFFPSESAFPLRESCHPIHLDKILPPSFYRTYCYAPCKILVGAQGFVAIWVGTTDFSPMWGAFYGNMECLP